MRPVTDIQLTPPLLPILSPSLLLPEWNSSTVDSLPSPIFPSDIASIAYPQKADLINECIYGSNVIRRMRALRVMEECVLLSNNIPFLTFDLILSVISQLVADRQWLICLAESCSLNKTLFVEQQTELDMFSIIQWKPVIRTPDIRNIPVIRTSSLETFLYVPLLILPFIRTYRL